MTSKQTHVSSDISAEDLRADDRGTCNELDLRARHTLPEFCWSTSVHRLPVSQLRLAGRHPRRHREHAMTPAGFLPESIYQPDTQSRGTGDSTPKRHASSRKKFRRSPRPDRGGANRLVRDLHPPSHPGRERTVSSCGGWVTFQQAIVAYHMPSGSHEQFAAVEVLTHLLDAKPAGRLYKTWSTGLGTGTSASAYGLKERGVLFARAEVRRKGDLHEAVEATLATLQGLADKPPTAEEVDRARTAFAAGFERAFNDRAPSLVAEPMGVVGRLAAHVPASGPCDKGHPRRCPGRGEGVSEDLQPYGRLFSSGGRDTLAGRDPGASRCRRAVFGLRRGEGRGRGRSVRTDAREYREPHH